MKKLVSLLLVVVFVVGLAMPVGALKDRETDGKQTHPSHHDPLNENPRNIPTIYDISNEIYGTNVYGDYVGDAAWYPEETYAGSIIEIPLLARGFLDAEGGSMYVWDDIDINLGPTVRQLKYNRITPEIQSAKGERYIESVELVEFTPTTRNPARAAIRITFVKDYVASKEFRYQFTVYLSRNGYRTDTGEVFSGRLSNEVFDVYRIDYMYIGDGAIAHAKSGTQMNLTLDLGNGVRLHRDMFLNESYYGVARLHGNEYQDPITRAYRKSIDTVIDIDSVDMKVNSAYVTLEKELSKPRFYVYNLAGIFVGMSDEKLAYSTRYYLSVDEIEINPALSQHPVPERHERNINTAVNRFIKGGLSEVGLEMEEVKTEDSYPKSNRK